MVFSVNNLAFGAYAKAQVAPDGPTLIDPHLTVEKVADGLDFPTSMAFVGNNEILVTEKNTGKVMKVLDGKVMEDPVLDVAVASDIERGLLGIAVSNNTDSGKTYVFLFYTESGGGTDGDDASNSIEPAGNRLYRYEYMDGKLINPVLLLDLPPNPINDRSEHIGGKVRIGPDNNVYVMAGEVGGHRTQAQNIADGPPPNGLGGVLRISQNGDLLNDDPIFGSDLPLVVYYAMGIRNSFGMDFDPVTGTLWDTENGPTSGDEINMITPGFNGGWSLIQGYAKDDLLGNGNTPADLVYFGKSHYEDPKFVWKTTIGITALKFLNSANLGKEYENNMFVGDINNGLLYRFTLNEERDNILINDTYSGNIAALADNQVDVTTENQPVIFGQGFGGITDMEVGPDGYLYILSYTGAIYRIVPSSTSSNSLISTSNNLISEQQTNTNSIPGVIKGINGDQSYSPNPITIQQGQTITWYNGDTVSHTVTSGQDGDSDEGELFDSNAIIPNQSFSLTFDEKGEYKYYCIYHPSMVGEIIVE